MKLEQLSQIVEIANTGSFSEAARSLYLSQPNLSRSVKQLEEELGFDIFVRKSDGVVLTEQGTALIERARIIERECQNLSEMYTAGQTNRRQILRVASLQSRVTAIIPPTILKYVGSPVDIVYLNCTSLQKLIELVRTLQVDYASMGVLSPYIHATRCKLKNYDMEYNVIARSELYAVVSSHNPLYQTQGGICLEQLYPFTVISYGDIEGDPQYNYAVALGIHNLVLSNVKTNNSNIFYQTIHQTAAVGIVATAPETFRHICAYDDLVLLPLLDSHIFVEYVWTKLRRVPLSDLAYDDLMSKQQFF